MSKIRCFKIPSMRTPINTETKMEMTRSGQEIVQQNGQKGVNDQHFKHMKTPQCAVDGINVRLPTLRGTENTKTSANAR